MSLTMLWKIFECFCQWERCGSSNRLMFHAKSVQKAPDLIVALFEDIARRADPARWGDLESYLRQRNGCNIRLLARAYSKGYVSSFHKRKQDVWQWNMLLFNLNLISSESWHMCARSELYWQDVNIETNKVAPVTQSWCHVSDMTLKRFKLCIDIWKPALAFWSSSY